MQISHLNRPAGHGFPRWALPERNSDHKIHFEQKFFDVHEETTDNYLSTAGCFIKKNLKMKIANPYSALGALVLGLSGLFLAPEVSAIIPFAFFKTQLFSLMIPFTAGTESSYTISDSSRVEFVGGVTRLKAADQTDNSTNTGASSGGFMNGTLTGAQWDTTNSVVRLNTSTNTAELDASWAPQWSSLVGYWKLNGSGTINTNDSVAATVGTNGVANNAGSFSYAAGKLNEGISFATGTNRFKVTTASPNSSAFTVSFWIKLTSFPAILSAPISATNAGTRVWQIHFNGTYTGDAPAIYAIYSANAAGSHAVSVADTFNVSDLGSWHHIVMTYNSAGSPRAQFYKDGMKLGMSLDAFTGNFPTHDTLWVGGRRGDDNGCCDSAGSIDELAIWSQDLTTAEVQAIYNRQSAKYSGQLMSRVLDAFSSQAWTTLSSTTKLPFYKELPGASGSEAATAYSAIGGGLMSGMTGLWHLNESSGTTATDSSGAGNNGTIVGSPGLGNNGVLGKAISFSGSGQYITVPTITLAGDFTLSAWTFLTRSGGGSQNDGVFGIAAAGNATNFNGNIYRLWNGSGNVVSATAAKYQVWENYVITRSGSSVTLYKDGVSLATGTWSGTMTVSALGAGNAGTATTFMGFIDEPAIWSRSLSTNEVKELYRRGANRLKYQVRTCSAADCSDQEALTSSGRGWKGPDNTQLSYFSELYNTTSNTLGGTVSINAPTMTFSNFSGTGLSVTSNRYVQYRAILESEDQNALCTYGNCSPELQSVAVGPNHYDTTVQTVTSNASLGSSYRMLDSGSFIETLGANSCSAGARYALSSNGSTFYYWNGSAWATSTNYSTANDAATISSNISSFPSSAAGLGTLQIKTFLKSTGTSSCEVDSLQVTGGK